jgi:tetratricopeptide (TPR) repeat protein
MRLIAVLLLLTACVTSTAPEVVPATAPAVVPPPAPLSPETRAKFEAELDAARAVYEQKPDDADAIIWLGRRTAYLGRYAEAIEIFTEGIRKHPRDARMLRHRGHRYITLRRFDLAIRDLERAARLVRNKPDQVEPDGLPNARNIPTSTLQSNIWYHLGLAHYLRGDFERALDAYQQCMNVSKNPDGLVSTSNWLYWTLRRLGRAAEAERVLEPISTDLEVIENRAYHELLLMARGEIDPKELENRDAATVDGTTVLYGVGNWYVVSGQPERARPIFERIVAGPQWAAFGYIAAEAELRR